jgi:hypothetical protein
MGLASFFLHGQMFGSVSDVSSLVLNARPIVLSKRLLAPSLCSFSLNGWSEGSQDFAADEYLKMRSLEIRVLNTEPAEEIFPKDEHMNIVTFETKSSGYLEIRIKEYEPSPRGLKRFDAELQCKSKISQASLFASTTLILLGLLAAIFIPTRFVWRRLLR